MHGVCECLAIICRCASVRSGSRPQTGGQGASCAINAAPCPFAQVLQEHGYETLRKRLGEEMKDLLK